MVLNPTLFVGSTTVKKLSDSADAIFRTISGQFPAIVDLTFPLIDARDAALYHVAALTKPSIESGSRVILHGHTVTHRQICDVLRESFPGYEAQLPKASARQRAGK